MTAGLAPRPPAAVTAEMRRVRLRTLVWIRWLALAGQTAALAVVRFGLDYDFPFVAAMSVVLVSGALNVAVSLLSPGDRWLGDREAAGQLAFDLLQLAALLALTGGLDNPFAVLILAPVTVSASLLGRWATAALALLAVALVSLLALWSLPLPGTLAGEPLAGGPEPALLDFGLWLALILALLFVALYLSFVSHEARRLAAALAASELALGREQQVSALGALAAAAAHELGTPLATIAVVTGELRRALPADSPLIDDLDLLRAESDRCREILARISSAPASCPGAGDPGAPFSRLPLAALVETAAAPYARPGVSLVVRGGADPTQPLVPRRPELLAGLGALLQNALQFAHSRVEVSLSWDARSVEIAIRDDGPGFELPILGRLGEPYLPPGAGRQVDGPHLGLGVFIAKALLGRGGAVLAFSNRAGGGAEVTISWPRAALVEP